MVVYGSLNGISISKLFLGRSNPGISRRDAEITLNPCEKKQLAKQSAGAVESKLVALRRGICDEVPVHYHVRSVYGLSPQPRQVPLRRVSIFSEFFM
jgi:hypothetical protein